MIKWIRRNLDFKLVGILALVYLFIEFVALLKYIYLNQQGLVEEPVPYAEYFFYTCGIDWLMVVIFMSLIAATTKYFLYKRVAWSKVIFFHILLSITLLCFIFFVGYTIDAAVGKEEMNAALLQKILYGIVNNSVVNLLVYMGLTGIIYVYYYFYKNKEAENREALLQNELLSTRLKLLNNQLHPHFLFNALNNVSALVKGNPEKAQLAIADLGSLIRKLLNFSQDHRVSLEKELEVVGKYVNLMKLKYGDKLKFHYNIAHDLDGVLVPSLILQPLIENSIKHGMTTTTAHLDISIDIFPRNGRLQIEVRNNGAPYLPPEEDSNGSGLANLRERLGILYRKDYTFSIDNESLQNEVQVKISLPMQFESNSVET